MKIQLIAALAVLTAVHVGTAAIFPETTGTRWEYQLTDSSASAPRQTIVTTIAGRAKTDGKDALEVETRIDGVLAKTEFLEVNERGVFCLRRSITGGKSTKFEPPQEVVPAILKFGLRWELNEEIAGTETPQQFTVRVEDDLVVPAGKFHTFLCESEQPWPISMVFQRWFSPGVGLVKEVITTRGPTGRLLSRATTVLQKFTLAPAASPNETKTAPAALDKPPAGPAVMLAVSKERDGQPISDFRVDAPHIFVRWVGDNLPVGEKIRVAWIAEDVGDLTDPNFVIDQSETTVAAPDARAQFTLSRPEDGWAAGKYRVDIFLDEKLIGSAKIRISE